MFQTFLILMREVIKMYDFITRHLLTFWLYETYIFGYERNIVNKLLDPGS